MGKCMQPRAHQLCVSVSVLLVGIVEKAMGYKQAVSAGASWVLNANLLVSIGDVVRLSQKADNFFPFQCLYVSWLIIV